MTTSQATNDRAALGPDELDPDERLRIEGQYYISFTRDRGPFPDAKTMISQRYLVAAYATTRSRATPA